MIKKEIGFALECVSHLFFPKICAGCGTDLREEGIICAACISDLPYTNFHMHTGNPVEKIFWGRVPLYSAFSMLFFHKHSVVRQLMHQLKYGGNRHVGMFLGNRMGELMLQSNRYTNVQYIAPLPLHPAKQKIRGYNQAQIIATGISEVINVPVEENLIRRATKNETQTQKNRIERWNNMSGKFKAVKDADLDKNHILLVDDVVTTGATLEACASILVDMNAQVSVATAAYTTM